MPMIVIGSYTIIVTHAKGHFGIDQTMVLQDLEAAHRDQLTSSSEQLETQRQVPHMAPGMAGWPGGGMNRRGDRLLGNTRKKFRAGETLCPTDCSERFKAVLEASSAFGRAGFRKMCAQQAGKSRELVRAGWGVPKNGPLGIPNNYESHHVCLGMHIPWSKSMFHRL